MSFRNLWLLALLLAPLLKADSTWTEPFPAHRIIGNVFYVGSAGLASFLITTPQGDILINSNLEASVPAIEKSVRDLGFRFEDIKILLISHAHYDHCAGSKLIQQRTHARYMVMDADVSEIEDGGRSDFAYGKSPDMLYPPTHVDRTLHDGSTVTLGGMVLTAHLTAGHTKGCTTWTMQVKDSGKVYNVVIVGSPNVNSGYKLVANRLYPQIADDYRNGFRTLEALPCDVFLGAHGEYYGLREKYAQLKTEQRNPFIDPQGYRDYVADRKRAFEEELRHQNRP